MSRLILGHTTPNSIKIWVRASSRWPVAFIDVLDESNNKMAKTAVVVTAEAEFYTAVVEWKELQPDTTYRTKLAFGKDKKTPEAERIRDAYTEGRFRTFPEPEAGGKYSFMFGSCNLHSLGILEKPDKAWLQVSKLLKENSARFMLHCGDQIYADIPLKPQASLEHYRNKYLDAWEDCVPAKKTLTEVPHYMILDDHEITNNFDNDLTDGSIDYQGLARVAMKVYWEFQHSHNPHSDLPGFHYHYEFECGKAKFFVMDTRYYRLSRSGQLLNPAQEAALLGWLSRHRDELKFIVSSVPFVAEVKSPDKDKWCDQVYDEQRGRILAKILGEDISKVVFLTGDMHSALHATLTVEDSSGKRATVHELMSSPINQLTPDISIERQYVPVSDPRVLGSSGVTIQSRIDPKSYFAKHSNIMAVEVGEDGAVGYKIYQTTSSSVSPVKSGSFKP